MLTSFLKILSLPHSDSSAKPPAADVDWLSCEARHSKIQGKLIAVVSCCVIAVSGSMNVGSRAVANDLYSPNSEATVGYVQTGSPQPSGFAMNVGV